MLDNIDMENKLLLISKSLLTTKQLLSLYSNIETLDFLD